MKTNPMKPPDSPHGGLAVEPRHTHPGHQKPMHTSTNGTEREHVQMGITPPTGLTQTGPNIHAGDASEPGKHVIPPHTFGPLGK